MKIAELFASLGFKITGQSQLDRVDERLRTSAANAGLLAENMAKLEAVMVGVKAAAAGVQQNLSAATTQTAAATKALGQQANAAAGTQAALANTTQAATQASQQLQQQQANVAQQTNRAAGGLVNVNNQTNRLTFSVSKLGLSYAGALLMMKRMATQSFESAIAMKNFSQETGLSISNLQQWQYQAVQNNVTAERMNETLSSLQTQLADIALGRRTDLQGWQLLGISPSMSPEKQLEQFRQKLRELPKGVARSLARDLGIGDDVYRVLISDTEKLNRRYVVTQEHLANINRLSQTWNRWWYAIKNSAISTFSALSVPLTWLMDKVSALMSGITRILDVALDLAGVLVSLAFPGIKMDKGSELMFDALKEKYKDLRKSGADALRNLAIPDALNTPPLLRLGAIPPMQNRMGGGDTSITQNVEIKVDGAKEPSVVAREIDRQLRQTYARTGYQAPLPAY